MKSVSAMAIAVAMFALAPSAHATILNLDASTSGSVSITGVPIGNVDVTMTTLSGNGNLQGSPILGNYTLFPPSPATFGASRVGATDTFAVGGTVNQALTYSAADGILAAIVTWTLIDGATNDIQFEGSFAGVGTGKFVGFSNGTVDLALTPFGVTVASLSNTGGTVAGGIGSGALISGAKGVPAPVEGAGLFGLIVGVGVLYLLSRRRHYRLQAA